MSSGRTFSATGRALGVGMAMVFGSLAAPAVAQDPTLSPEAFEASKQLYFRTLRRLPRRAAQRRHRQEPRTRTGKRPRQTAPSPRAAHSNLGQERLEKIIAWGTEGGMNNFSDVMTEDEIRDMATYIMMEPPKPPEMSLAQMMETRKVYVSRRITRPSRCMAGTGRTSSSSSSVMWARWP